MLTTSPCLVLGQKVCMAFNTPDGAVSLDAAVSELSCHSHSQHKRDFLVYRLPTIDLQ